MKKIKKKMMVLGVRKKPKLWIILKLVFLTYMLDMKMIWKELTIHEE